MSGDLLISIIISIAAGLTTSSLFSTINRVSKKYMDLEKTNAEDRLEKYKMELDKQLLELEEMKKKLELGEKTLENQKEYEETIILIDDLIDQYKNRKL